MSVVTFWGSPLRAPTRLAAAAALATGLTALPAHAAKTETEPNNSCASPQALGKLSAGAKLAGEIVEGDIDFFQLTGNPGKWMELEVVRDASTPGTDMQAGVSDGDCVIMVANNVSVMAMMPPSGKLVFAAAGYGDWAFSGMPAEFGKYHLTAGTPRHAYVLGTVLDGDTGAVPPYASALVRLMACTSADPASCTDQVNTAYASDRDGSYYMPLADLPAGPYLLKMTANGFHDPVYSKVMTLGPDAGIVTQDFKLKPPKLPVTLGELKACSVLKAGTDCSYSYQVKNTTTAPVTVDVWSHLIVPQTVGAVEAAEFDAGKGGRAPKQLTLQPGEKKTVTQALGASGMPSGITGSVQLYASVAGKPIEILGYHPGFEWRITETGTVPPLRPQPQASRARAAASDTVTITGTVADANGQPISAGLTLRWCWSVDDSICAQPTLTTKSTANGRYAFRDAASWGAGRYQVWVDDRNFDQAHGPAFNFDGVTSSSGGKLVTQSHLVTIDGVTDCNGTQAEILGQYPASLSAGCQVAYNLSNHGSAPVTLDTWVEVLSDRSTSVDTSGSQYQQISLFSAGKKAGFTPRRITLQAGETRAMTQAVDFSGTPLSTGGAMAVWAAPADQPLLPAAVWSRQLFSVVP